MIDASAILDLFKSGATKGHIMLTTLFEKELASLIKFHESTHDELAKFHVDTELRKVAPTPIATAHELLRQLQALLKQTDIMLARAAEVTKRQERLNAAWPECRQSLLAGMPTPSYGNFAVVGRDGGRVSTVRESPSSIDLNKLEFEALWVKRNHDDDH
jgi:hypothetical protein